MKQLSLIFLCCSAVLVGHAQQDLFITHANLLDVSKQRVLPDQTVVIRGDSILSIGKHTPPAGALIIDATGKYLMPGMTDAHVHFFQSGSLYTRPDIIDLRKEHPYEEEIQWTHDHMEDQLRRYIQCGITTVFDAGASERFLTQRKDFAAKAFSPTIYMAGPLLTDEMPEGFTGLPGEDAPFVLVKTPEEARTAVDAQLSFQPDLIKIWYLTEHTTAEAFYPCVQAAVDEAHRHHLKVAVHATQRLTAQLAVQAGADYLVHSVDDEILPDDFISLLRLKKVVLCPTLMVEDGYENTFAQTLQFGSQELLGADPFALGSLLDMQALPDTTLVQAYKRKADGLRSSTATRDSIRMVNLKKLADGGVTIVSGTDAGNIGTLHATSYIAELKRMHQSGLSNWQVLQASTSGATTLLNGASSRITPGQKANMVLLRENPADDLDHLTEIALVINKGVPIRPDTLVQLTPEGLVQQQLDAYNAHDLESFVATYSDSVEIFLFPNRRVCYGKDQMRKVYNFLHHSPTLHCQILHRIVQGNRVIDQEHITGVAHVSDGTAIYEVEAGKIRRVYMVL